MKSALITVSFALFPALFLLAPGAQTAPPAPSRIALVSGQRILTESPEAKAEVARLQVLQQQRAGELRTKQQALETTRQQLAQAGADASRIPLQQQEQQQRTDLERTTLQAQGELQTLQRQLQTDIQTKVKAVVEDLVKGQDIQVVLNGDTTVIWAAPGVDLTSAVIERLNAK